MVGVASRGFDVLIDSAWERESIVRLTVAPPKLASPATGPARTLRNQS